MKDIRKLVEPTDFMNAIVSYTKKEKIIDIGPIEAPKEEKKTLPLPPLTGGLPVVGGIAVLVDSSGKSI